MAVQITPMMRQYLDLKDKHSDCLLFFRLGDFYEMFFEDAVTASKELDIALTGRDCGLNERAPMCGVPYHSVDSYITKLIDKGYKVAICEQLTDPAQSKGIVERGVIRIITPGTVIEESMLDEKSNSYLCSVLLQGNALGLAYCDISTGSFTLMELTGDNYAELYNELARIAPKEIIANDAVFLQETLVKRLQASYFTQRYHPWAFEEVRAREKLQKHFGVSSLACFNLEDKAFAVCAGGALLAYLEETQKNALTHIKKAVLIERCAFMRLDESTRRNLELTHPLRHGGSKKNTLLYILDKTKTAMGARLLRSWIDQPLQNAEAVERRLDAVDELLQSPIARASLRDALGAIHDMERLCSKIAYGTVNARDCESLRCSLEKLPGIIETARRMRAEAFVQIAGDMDEMDDVHSLLARAIVENPPLGVKDGGIIREGYNHEVDSFRDASKNGKEWLARLEADERAKTGIKSLKVGYNRVFGYYIEVTKSYQGLVPYYFERKQTLANSERYITPKLKELEETILGADEKCIALEYALFTEIRDVLSQCIQRLQTNAALIAELDVYYALAEVSASNRYCRPRITEDGLISIKDGRHPVVERSIKDGFIPNDASLNPSDDRLLILTGPNMAGKSTYMRQVALITLMAHIGCFVPAKRASICITDRIFTRVGASDNLASGQSTFMVEMSEMANILHNATSNSLLILDEIGRGTSTFDGLSIAWAVLEHIASPATCGAKTLFATHYHELTELEGKLPGVKNYRISVKEVGDDIIFLRKIVRGGADKSFGIQVARLAGLPAEVIQRAKAILHDLESADINHSLVQTINGFPDEPAAPEQITLFGTTRPDDVMHELSELDVNAFTPVEALNKLYDLHIRAKLR